jgi:hypothetical protein
MQPFDSYPHEGRALLGVVRGSNCRHGYGLQFMQITGQTSCAYCDKDLVCSRETWLNLALDHVVPTSICNGLGLVPDWVDDCANRVLACSACNGFANRFKPLYEVLCPLSLDDFFNLRDRIFAERKSLIRARHEDERTFFNRRMWEARR